MQKLILALIALLLVAGCSRHFHPLEASKKARLVSELISESAQCSAYRDQLGAPSIDDDSVDDIYRAATKAHCIKKDV